MFLTNYFLQIDENLLQKSCVVIKQAIFRQKEKLKTQKLKMNYFFNASTARSNFIYLFIFSPLQFSHVTPKVTN
jgi:hypothetical protein